MEGSCNQYTKGDGIQTERYVLGDKEKILDYIREQEIPLQDCNISDLAVWLRTMGMSEHYSNQCSPAVSNFIIPTENMISAYYSVFCLTTGPWFCPILVHDAVISILSF